MQSKYLSSCFYYFILILAEKDMILVLFISASETQEGFIVGLTTSSGVWSGSNLIFPHLVTNIGNGYNPTTGKFTASKKGTYVFFVTVNSSGQNYIYLDIVHNGASKVRTMSHNTASYLTGTNMAVLELNKGDTVWVKRNSGQVISPSLYPLLHSPVFTSEFYMNPRVSMLKWYFE